MDILQYDFMRRAFLVGLLISVIVPCVGVVVVLKRLSMIGDALSHTSLAGVAAGLILGVNPILGAVVMCTAAALSIEFIRKRMPRYQEMSIAIIMSAGIGLAGVLSGFVPGNANFNSFLFGSIVAIDDFELWMVAVISCLVLLCFIVFYRELFFIALDERAARLAGVPVGAINFAFTILTAACVSVAARTVGALIVSSLMVIPTACAMRFARSYRQTVLYSVGFAVFFMLVGLVAAFYLGLRPGGAVVLTGVICLSLILVLGGRRARGAL